MKFSREFESLESTTKESRSEITEGERVELATVERVID